MELKKMMTAAWQRISTGKAKTVVSAEVKRATEPEGLTSTGDLGQQVNVLIDEIRHDLGPEGEFVSLEKIHSIEEKIDGIFARVRRIMEMPGEKTEGRRAIVASLSRPIRALLLAAREKGANNAWIPRDIHEKNLLPRNEQL